MLIFPFQFPKLNNKIRKNATHRHQTQPPTFDGAARKRSPTSSTAIYHLPDTKSKWEDRGWRICHDQCNPRDIVEIKDFVAAIWRYRTIPCSYTCWPSHAQLVALPNLWRNGLTDESDIALIQWRRLIQWRKGYLKL